ncbi:hypothetical protein F4778DRAFT_776600 [Xylariomycetidae sp. FL2044]|nr:hypothetical protein F4778DRAFT_776600 [Xylariomycetidae sp. FL2044]
MSEFPYDRSSESPSMYDSFEDKFRVEAQLYLLACEFDIEDLKAMIMRRLHDVLMVFRPWPARIKELNTLIRTLFRHTQPSDPIRTMLVYYCTALVQRMANDDEYTVVFSDVPDFSNALLQRFVDDTGLARNRDLQAIEKPLF